MVKKYIVRLSDEEEQSLKEIISNGKHAAKKILHANILLKADERYSWSDELIGNVFDVSICTVQRVRQRLVEEGLESALCRKKHSRTRSRKLDGEKEAKLVALACSKAPDGRTRWTINLLKDKLIELNIIDSVGRETVRQTLKKTKLNHGKK